MTENRNIVITLWNAYLKLAAPFSFTRVVNEVSYECYVICRPKYYFKDQPPEGYEEHEETNSGFYKSSFAEANIKHVRKCFFGHLSVISIQKHKEDIGYSLSNVDIPLEFMGYNYLSDSKKSEIESFIIKNITKFKFPIKKNKMPDKIGKFSPYDLYYCYGDEAYNGDIRMETLYVSDVIRSFFESVHDMILNHRITMPFIANGQELLKNERHKRKLFKILNRPYSITTHIHAPEELEKDGFIKDRRFINTFKETLDAFVGEIPLNFDFINDLRKNIVKLQLEDDYTWYENAPLVRVKHNGVEKTVNPRKEFFYAFPNFSKSMSIPRHLEKFIDDGVKLIPVIHKMFGGKYSISTIKAFSKVPLATHDSSIESIRLSLGIIDNLPKLMRENFDKIKIDSKVETSAARSTFHILSKLFSIIPDDDEMNIMSSIRKEKGDLIDLGMRIISEIYGPDNDIHYNNKTSLARINLNRIEDFTKDTLPIFSERVLIPIASLLSGVGNVDINDRIIDFVNSMALKFFLSKCKMGIAGLFYINRIAHENTKWFARCGSKIELRKLTTEAEFKENEDDLHEAFNVIRFDKYRDILELDKQADWMPLISESYKDEESGYTIVPLISRYDLIEEGEQMKNCVGEFGYDIKSASGKCRIFTIIDKENFRSATMEISYDVGERKISLVQLEGYENKGLMIKSNSVANRFIENINNGTIPANWSNINEETVSGKELLNGGNGNKEEDYKKLYVRAKYDVTDNNKIRIAAEPWKQFMPKKYKSFNVESFRDIDGMESLIKQLNDASKRNE